MAQGIFYFGHNTCSYYVICKTIFIKSGIKIIRKKLLYLTISYTYIYLSSNLKTMNHWKVLRFNWLTLYRVLKWWCHGLLLNTCSIVIVPNKRSLHQALGSGLEPRALVLLATVVITDPRTAWNCLEPVSMLMKSYMYDVTLRYSILMPHWNWYIL